MLEAIFDGLTILLIPERLLFLSIGVLIGLFLGAIPGLGGIVGMAMLLPFTFDMDRTAAIAMLVALSAVVVSRSSTSIQSTTPCGTDVTSSVPL